MRPFCQVFKGAITPKVVLWLVCKLDVTTNVTHRGFKPIFYQVPQISKWAVIFEITTSMTALIAISSTKL
ncbi:MAG: hypothetical protein ACI84R_003236 [Candidatus Azotimanducaceae bacterium]|jgi:hypothetical protein